MTTPDHQTPTLDAARLARLRALATGALARVSRETVSRRAMLAGAVQADGATAERLASLASAAALAEAREEGYRSAVADLLGALEVGA